MSAVVLTVSAGAGGRRTDAAQLARRWDPLRLSGNLALLAVLDGLCARPGPRRSTTSRQVAAVRDALRTSAQSMKENING
jgi:hypothetical protein